MSAPFAAPVVLLMGVSGSGKTTVGRLLAKRLGWEFADADDFHSVASIEKMRHGVPLTDEDREPWLRAIGAWIDSRSGPAVVTCSALKRRYRDVLRAGRPQVMLADLVADREVLAERLRARHGHFFPADLLDSQLADLEPPAPEEEALTVRVEATPADAAEEIVAGLHLDRGGF